MADQGEGFEHVDAFSLLLPLPYRLAAVITLSVWLWGLNLKGLDKVSIDTTSLIRYQARVNPPPDISTFRFATLLSIPLAFSIAIFSLFSRLGTQTASHFLPNLTLILICATFVVPSRWILPRSFVPINGRASLLRTLQRVSIGGLARLEDGKFGDVLLADALTSMARPLSEFYITLCAALTGSTVHACSMSSVIPFILAYPFAIRFRQCIIDGQRANAAKYATAFPAIALSTFMKTDKNMMVLGLPVSNLWMLAAMTNALYSFYWDVTFDWDLTLLSHKAGAHDHPYGLRRIRYYRDEYYYAMIAVDLLLRFAWALKLSPHLEHYYDIEGGIFLLELLEVGRRWLWVYFRVETEHVRTKDALQHLHDEFELEEQDSIEL